MPDIGEITQQLEEVGFRFNPGASPEDIQALEATLGCILPSEMVALFRHGDGMPPFQYEDDGGDLGDVFRLVSIQEAREMHPHLKEFGFNAFGRRCFWTDDQSNYAALYVDGPLTGRVCLLEHDGPDPSPLYRSVLSFLRIVAAAGKTGFFSTPLGDYPALEPIDPEDTQRDFEAAKALRPLLDAASPGVERELYAYAIMVLTPYEQTEAILPFTYDKDFYIQAKACNILGLRRYEPAIPRLAEVAIRGVSNGKSAATLALGRIGTGPALRELVRVHESLPAKEVRNSWDSFRTAFADCGCEIDNSNRWNPRYREPGGEKWKSLRRKWRLWA